MSHPILATWDRIPDLRLAGTPDAPLILWMGQHLSVANTVTFVATHHGTALAAELAHWIAQMLYQRTWRPSQRARDAEALRHQAERGNGALT